MKTSNKILILASLIVIAYLTTYDLGLKAEYLKGAFKSPLYNMQPLKFASFTVIQHNAANIIELKIEKGPYGVWVDDNLKDRVTLSQHGDTLSIDFINQKANWPKGFGNGMVVYCPDVASVSTAPTFMLGEMPRNPGMFWSQTTTITGFDQAAMQVRAGRFTEIGMKKNTLGQLNATIGDKPDGHAGLTINADNHITLANLNVPGKSKLSVLDLVIDKINYNLADSADVRLTGKAAHLLDHQ